MLIGRIRRDNKFVYDQIINDKMQQNPFTNVVVGESFTSPIEMGRYEFTDRYKIVAGGSGDNKNYALDTETNKFVSKDVYDQNYGFDTYEEKYI